MRFFDGEKLSISKNTLFGLIFSALLSAPYQTSAMWYSHARDAEKRLTDEREQLLLEVNAENCAKIRQHA